MLLKSMVKPKKDLTTVREDATLEEALDILEESGFRCVPVLDKRVACSVEIFTKCIFIATNHAVDQCKNL